MSLSHNNPLDGPVPPKAERTALTCLHWNNFLSSISNHLSV